MCRHRGIAGRDLVSARSHRDGDLQRGDAGVRAGPPWRGSRRVRDGQGERKAAVLERDGGEPVAQLRGFGGGPAHPGSTRLGGTRPGSTRLGPDLEGVQSPGGLASRGAQVRFQAPAVTSVAVPIAAQSRHGLAGRRPASRTEQQPQAVPVKKAGVGGDEVHRGGQVNGHIHICGADGPPS